MPAVPIRWVLVGDPEGKFAAEAFLYTNLAVEAHQPLEWFVQRWQAEVTFDEARAHLDVEMQPQCADNTIARTTPTFLGLYSLVTLLVRRRLWYEDHFPLSNTEAKMRKIPRTLLERLTTTLC